ncbi:hypothetical protein HanIR_Chr03g0116121 [Helianthus annuus]|nr:hypothetical protein HanIR_Chr03g0116121 [Helianthus annuus]
MRFFGRVGIGPVSLLKLESSRVNSVSEANELGNDPDMKLWEMSKVCNFLRFEISGGMTPENELDPRMSVWRLGRVKREVGIGPENLLSDRSMVISWTSCATSGERVPA